MRGHKGLLALIGHFPSQLQEATLRFPAPNYSQGEALPPVEEAVIGKLGDFSTRELFRGSLVYFVLLVPELMPFFQLSQKCI